jgi:hypothetical protein
MNFRKAKQSSKELGRVDLTEGGYSALYNELN